MTEEYCTDCQKRCKRCGTALPTYETPKTKRSDDVEPAPSFKRGPSRPKRGGE